LTFGICAEGTAEISLRREPQEQAAGRFALCKSAGHCRFPPRLPERKTILNRFLRLLAAG